jgi:type I restriction enzyme R subunit
VTFAESDLEEALLAWLRSLGWDYVAGPVLSPGGEAPERRTYADVVLIGRLRRALIELNPELPGVAIDDAVRKVAVLLGATTIARNHAFHRMITDGVPVEYVGDGGRVIGDRAVLVDRDGPLRNDLLAVNQLTIIDGSHERRPDVVLFVNGLPLVVIELKKPGDEDATVDGAFNQLETYKQEIPEVFSWNEILVVSDGTQARAGTTTSEWKRFTPWKTVDGTREHAGYDQLRVLAHGMLEPSRLVDLVTGYIVFEADDAGLTKKLATYRQYWAVRKAIDCAITASHGGDGRAGVVWHTQGSGKSLEMVMLAGRLIRDPRMANPTIVVLTDRIDLDDQLYDAFSAAIDLIPSPAQAERSADLVALLSVPSGGVVFTKVQLFRTSTTKVAPGVSERTPHQLLSDRQNIVVLADEAHRSHYDLKDGFALAIREALPNATFIGFTGTPLETGDRVTRAVFGDYIDVYDVLDAVEDGATVPIYYEGRLVEIDLDPAERDALDEAVEELTEAEEDTAQRLAKSKWARIEALVGADERIKQVAADLVDHFERRSEAIAGKGMIVCMSRNICARLYREITALRPSWHGDGDDAGGIKVVITGSAADVADLRPHIRNRKRNKAIQARLRDPADELKLVIVRDMWLTGFDAPVLHTMYIDKLMRGHGLMQAIARVNRVFTGKPGGLVVDYLGIGPALKAALANYTANRGKGEIAVDLTLAVSALIEKLEALRDLLHPFDFSGAFGAEPVARYDAHVGGLEAVLAQADGEVRFIALTNDMLKAFKLAGATPEALERRDEIVYFLELRGALAKVSETGKKHSEALDFALGQLVSRAVVAEGVVDIFAAVGMDRPDISLVSDRFLAEVQSMPQRNLAAAALEKLLRDEIRIRRQRNVVQAQRFSAMLDAAMTKYHNRAIEAAQVVLELVEMAKHFREAARRGEKLNLTDDELSFYDALGTNDSAVELLGDETLRAMARELAAMLRNSVTVDWKVRESVRADLRVKVKRLLRKYKYPPDEQDAATQLVIEQTEVLADSWDNVVPFPRYPGPDDADQGRLVADQSESDVEGDGGSSV